ncbi:4Fe-4S_binding protein [Hexamita inflata]|uniref:4Fe-4S binding protein n=1 Tax=Hexamita inflata TaxID=28002 RepID=A0AA86U1R6_9EUKA|nr:4Fe-4S binding protein [Hexamita inflata]
MYYLHFRPQQPGQINIGSGCVGCDACVSCCPQKALDATDGQVKLVGECNGCGDCVNGCPTETLKL